MRITLTVEALEHPDRPPAIIRLRKAFKSLWRAHGVRVLSAKPDTTDSNPSKPRAAKIDDER